MTGTDPEPARTATGRRWRQRAAVAPAPNHPRLPAFLNQVLAARGRFDSTTAESFLRGQLDREHDPRLLPQIAAALDRIAAAIRGDKLIAVFGDYDVDGITATAILVEGLTDLGARVIPYLPNRFTEGYGVSPGALAELHRRGASLVLTADCGVSAVDEIAFANDLGLDVIVVDHHSIPERLPDAVALIDPKLEGCAYPCTELAACGLAFKLVQALAEHLGSAYDPQRHLDLVALGTVCDMAPLLGENRWLVRQGLKSMATSTRPGLRALAEVSGSDLRQVNAEMLGFRLGPRINAAGRLDDAGTAYELLTTRDEPRARALANRLQELNLERQRLTTAAVELCRRRLDVEGADGALIMVGDRAVSQGIVGLVAGRLVEAYGRPAVVYEAGDAECRGSARSVPAFDIVAALRAASRYLVRFGGHRQAGGFTARTVDMAALRDFLGDWTRDRLADADLTPVLEYDAELPLNTFGPEQARWLPFLEPCGQGNPEPLFVSRGLRVERSRAVGKDSTHLQLSLHDGARPWHGIAFGLAHAAPARGDRIDALFAVKTDDRGRAELHVKDFAVN